MQLLTGLNNSKLLCFFFDTIIKWCQKDPRWLIFIVQKIGPDEPNGESDKYNRELVTIFCPKTIFFVVAGSTQRLIFVENKTNQIFFFLSVDHHCDFKFLNKNRFVTQLVTTFYFTNSFSKNNNSFYNGRLPWRTRKCFGNLCGIYVCNQP